LNNTQWLAGNQVHQGEFESVDRLKIKTGEKVTLKDEYYDRKESLLAFLSLFVPWGVGGVP
jgi:hypothetical protein